MRIRQIVLMACVAAFSTRAFAQGLPHMKRGEWKDTSVANGSGIKDTSTVCNHGQAFTSWMMSKQGSTCMTTGVPVIEGNGRTVFQENCLSRQPQGGAAHIHMTVHLTVTGVGRRFRSTVTGQVNADGYHFPINDTVTGHYVGACRHDG
ncbi:hypothetical protein [Acidithiobacillus sp.]|uniref:hypothetical protein n=1 Tax=Acidithiobacillus sp. TaxID=1872118 RepID=UPI0025BF4271|nr:hypothetical protein [Acidithiobacillus sp.]MCK9188961.1 hypothetical protein [Acidithiobacillus sp.]MCK9358255.1 hypothetical protein [Acidithiobacillus sp.]